MRTLEKYYIDIYGYHMRMKNFARLVILIPLSLIVTNIYENKTATIINLVALTIFLFYEPYKKSIVGKGTKYLVGITLIVDIILHLSVPKSNLTTTIANYSIMLLSLMWTFIMYCLCKIAYEEFFEEKYLEVKINIFYFVITTYITYLLTLIIGGYDYSWIMNDIKPLEIGGIILLLITIHALTLGVLYLFDFDFNVRFICNYKINKIYHNECEDHPTNQDSLNGTLKPEPIIKNSKFEQIADDIQNYIDAIAIQAFNQYEPQQHVLNALIKAKEDIQQIAQNYETRQQIDNNDNLTHYFEQAEQIKENTKNLCNEFLDYVEQHKPLSSKEDIQNIQTILEKLNDKGE